MAEKQPLNDDLESFAAALSDLTPQPTRLNRDRLMEDVCRSAALTSLSEGRASLRFWKLATGVSTLTAAMLAGLLCTNLMHRPVVDLQTLQASRSQTRILPEPVVAEGLHGVDLASPIGTPMIDFGMSYISQRNQALIEGIENSPLPRVTGYEAPAVPEPLREPWEPVSNRRELRG